MRLLFLLLPALIAAQDLSLLKTVKYRSIGPYRGGRVTTVAGADSLPGTYYFGATGGGIWKTTDSGASWQSLSDGQPFGTGSVGSIDVSASDPNTVYAGMGEAPIRGNVTHGDGMYKSTDAGHTWKHIGLADTRQIARVRIHPKNPDIVYVAALGHVWGPNEERGIYRTRDGGQSWQHVFTRGPKAGAIDLAMDPSNPNILWAGFWEVYRKPWTLESGGPGSGLFRSTDGGDTWTDLTRAPGLPKGTIGTIGVTVSPANPERVWVMIEAEDGGLFRSDNSGKEWTRVNEERKLRQRAWYYNRIFADPKNPDVLYAVNVNFFRSGDGGRTFQPVPTPHGDNHDLWIAPSDPQRMIEGNDGGANVSVNGGRSWSNLAQPTAQFYRVALDNQFPYNIYGAQQDNTTIEIASRTLTGSIDASDWRPVGGGESGWIAPDPKNPDVVFAGSYDGLLTRYDRRTQQTRNVTVWPDNPMGAGAEAMKYRFQWNFPLLFSPHDPTLLYAGGNMLFASRDQGQSWTPISPDLTRNDKSKLGSSGGPITKDNTSVEYYCTIFTVAESTLKKGLIWTGSDDGLVYITQDGGQHWRNVTPKSMPEWIQINSIEASPHDPGTAYVAATMYKWDDNRPYLYKTTDYGKSWKQINEGIPAATYTRVVREDPNRPGLLFAGAETGIYVSFNAGVKWQSIQLNLPTVQISDLAFHKREKELVIATHGRSFWVFDDLPLLYQLADGVPEAAHLFQPKDTYRLPSSGGFGGPKAAVGQNPPNGAVIYYSFREKPAAEVTLEFLDAQGKPVKTYSSKIEEKHPPDAPAASAEEEEFAPRSSGSTRVAVEPGLNKFVWDLRYPDAVKFPGMILWAGSVRGPAVVPGVYTVKLTVDGKSQSQTFRVNKDPRIETTDQEFQSQLSLELQIRDKLTQTHQAILDIRDVRKQVEDLAARTKVPLVIDRAKALSKELTQVEETLYQTKNKAPQDPLNYPIRLNNRLAGVLAALEMSDSGPTRQQQMVFEDLATGINAQLKRLDEIMKRDLPAFNKLVRDQNIPAIATK
ncbi:MAG: glycosyl hydrolase [Acidobacteriota bacterium]|nr:glycosyl hydrolase [Acidobacteriota bacterium]